eukprot:scaffold23788_cov126-Isochrysis_galbana.AAC.6
MAPRRARCGLDQGDAVWGSWTGGVARPRPAHSSSLEEEDGRPRATTRLPAGRMRAAWDN